MSELVVDIETIPDYARIDAFGFDPLPTYAHADYEQQPALVRAEDLVRHNIDDIGRILAEYQPCEQYLTLMKAFEDGSGKPRKGVLDAIDKCRKAMLAPIEAMEARRLKMSTTPEFCRIVCIGVGLPDGSYPVASVTDDTNDAQVNSATEEKILEWFWAHAKQHQPIVGFNILGFDLPAILVRSILLDIAPKRRFDLKPWGGDIVDLMLARWPRGGQMKLKAVAPAMGIEVPAGDCDGSQVEELWRENPEKLADYCRSDVQITKALYHKYRNYFC